MKQLDIEAKYIRSKTFWDQPDEVEKKFNNWMIENSELKVIAIETTVTGVDAGGYTSFRTVTNVVYLITEEMHEQDLKKKKERDEWYKNRENFE